MASSTSSLLTFLSPLSHSNSTSLPIKLTPPNSISISTSSRNGALSPLKASKSELPEELMAVVNPSMANSNTMFFRSAYNVQVVVEDNEPEERLLNRFRREVMRAGVIQECKRRRFFENKQDEKKRKTREAAKRNSRRRRFNRGPFQNREEVTKAEKKDDDEDNWDMPEGGDAPTL